MPSRVAIVSLAARTSFCNLVVSLASSSFAVFSAAMRRSFSRFLSSITAFNFLINAAEAADKKNSWIKLNVFLEEKRQNALIIEVKDNGRGINKSNMDTIFDPFFSTKSSKGGTGMGLYLCRTLADQMGACIEVDSEVGKGSTFRLITGKNEKTNR